MTDIKESVLHEKAADTIVLLRRKGPSYPKNLSEETDTTYSYLVRMLADLEEEELVEAEEKGRMKIYSLTPKGKKLGDELLSLYQTSLINSDFGSKQSDRSGSSRNRSPRPALSDSFEKQYS